MKKVKLKEVLESELVENLANISNLEDVIIASRTLLKDNGRMYMVHRPERLADILNLMRKYKIEPKRIRMVHPNTKKAPNIVLVEGQRDGGHFLKWDPPLYVYDDNGEYDTLRTQVSKVEKILNEFRKIFEKK